MEQREEKKPVNLKILFMLYVYMYVFFLIYMFCINVM